MNKIDLITYLESTKTPINNDSFVKALLESRPDIMELDVKTPQGGIYDINDRDKYEEIKKQKQESKKDNNDKVKSVKNFETDKESNKQNEANKKGESVDEPFTLNIINDAGSKQVAYDDAFKNITDKLYASISDLFTPEAVELINVSDPSDWKEVDRRVIMCNESDYKSSKTKINCYNSSNPTGIGKPNIFNRNYINKYYKPEYSVKLKDSNSRFIVFTVADLSEIIYVLDISPNQNGVTYAIKSKLSSEKNPYLMKGSKLHTNFLFKDLNND